MPPRKARKSLAPKGGSSRADHGSDDGDDDEIEIATFGPQQTRGPVSRRPPTVSGKTRVVVSTKGGPPKSRAHSKRDSEAPTIPPPPLDRPAGRTAEPPKPAPRPAKRTPATVGVVVEEVTANLSKDPRRES
jgi:hypothetical protein